MTDGTRVRFGDTRLYVRDVGSGPPLLLVNGLGAHTAMWSTFEGSLPGIRILEFDLPGAGQSDVPWRPMSIRRQARLAGAVLDHFGIDRADVLGYSMGGVVAQQFAADAPDRVRRLVLVATTPGVGAVQGDLAAFFQIMTPARYLSARSYVRSIGTLTGGRARRDTAWIREQGALRMTHAPTWRGYFGQLASMSRWSGLPLLPRLRPPTLVLAGDDDPLTPVVNGMMIAYLIPRARLAVLPGEGHLMLLDADSQCHGLIRNFLTADDVAGSQAWQRARPVGPYELRMALARPGPQLPPWSIANARMRRRHLRLEPGAPAERIR